MPGLTLTSAQVREAMRRASAADLLALMAGLNRTVEQLENGSTFEKLELAPRAIAEARALLDTLVCVVLEQSRQIRELMNVKEIKNAG